MKTEQVLKYLLPRGMEEYFTVTDIREEGDVLHLYLEEKDIVPQENKGRCIQSKGFYPEREILDYPIRDRAVSFHIKRRRWVDKATKKEIILECPFIAKGTKYTKEFADFLKEVDRK